MKRLLLVLLTIVMATTVMAGDLTPQQALEQAQRFIKQMEANGSRARRAQGSAAQQLRMTKQVSGLYVFNISDNGGFVIVSNDDCTVPILGYSDSGSIDPDNMPSNMKAWLQGYADEIAWAKEHHVASATSASRRVGTHSTDAIEPLLKTQWDQSAPFNNNVPNGVTNGFAVGCVATAMAQVMYYTEKKAGSTTTTTTAEIPAYQTDSYKIDMPAIPAGTTINWEDIIDDYRQGYTSAQATAVANLMLYCGCSVKMDYGPMSGAQASDVPAALTSYFGYEASTIQYATRSSYTYANWTDMIYHELEEGRAIFYRGQSVDMGHSFVCDGYKYEDSTDLFHINWGWSGLSDGYFVLSVLNPNQQGIGGSATNSAFTLGQAAVVGIQKAGDTGTVIGTKNNNDLTFNSFTFSHNTIALGESVDITLNVTNNSSDVYDGDLWLSKDHIAFLGKTVVIPAGVTQDYVISYTPDRAGVIDLSPGYVTGDGNIIGPDDLKTLHIIDQTPTGITFSDQTYYWEGNVSWTNVGDASKWNLRKRPLSITIQDFNDAENIGNWRTASLIPDGTKWRLNPTGGIDNSPCYMSASYENGTDNNPYCALVSPEMRFGCSFSFYIWATTDGEEYFDVWLSSDGMQFMPITDKMVASDTPTEYTVNLGEYGGKGYIAIIHYSSGGHTSDSFLFVDNASWYEPSGSGDWTTMSDLTTNSCALTELPANTNYQVQAQAVINGGGRWSNPFIFQTASDALTLLDDDSSAETKNTDLIDAWNGHAASVTMSGCTLKGNHVWNTCCLPFDLPVNLLSTFGISGDAEVKVLDQANTSLDDTGKLTLRFTTVPATIPSMIPAGTPFVIKLNATDDVDIPTIPSTYLTIKSDATAKANMTQTSDDGKVKFVGEWSTFDITSENMDDILYIDSSNSLAYSKTPTTLKSFRAHFRVKPGEGGSPVSSIETDLDGVVTGIENLTPALSQGEGVYYDLQGRRIANGQKPTAKGVYIHNGKRFINR